MGPLKKNANRQVCVLRIVKSNLVLKMIFNYNVSHE